MKHFSKAERLCHCKYRADNKTRMENSLLPSIFCDFNKDDTQNMHLTDTVQTYIMYTIITPFSEVIIRFRNLIKPEGESRFCS